MDGKSGDGPEHRQGEEEPDELGRGAHKGRWDVIPSYVRAGTSVAKDVAIDSRAMLSRDLLREDPDRVRQALANRNADPSLLENWQRLDAERRAELVEVEELKRQRNDASREIGKIKQQKGDASEAIAGVGRMKARIEELEARLAAIDPELQAIELSIPNLPHESVPVGRDESANRVEKVVGEPRQF